MRLKQNQALSYTLLGYFWSYPSIISFSVAGVSFVFLRDVLLAGCLAFIAFVACTKNSLRKFYLIPFVFIAAFFLSVLLASGSGFSLSLSAPLLLRILLLFLLVFYFSFVRFQLNQVCALYKVLSLLFAFYVFVSLLSAISALGWSPKGGMEGYSGQHFSKFIFVLSSLFFVNVYFQSKWAKRKVKRHELMILLGSLICLFLVLQRSALLAFLVGLFFMFLGRGQGKVIRNLIYFMVSVSLFLLFLLNNERFLSYAFFDSHRPADLIGAIIDGSFSIDMIRARGRIELAEVLLSNFQFDFIGQGPGSAKSMLEKYFYPGVEPHNDALLMLVDYGYFGFLAFYGFFISYCTISYRRFKTVSSVLPFEYSVLFYGGLGATVGFMLWSCVSNVFVYIPYNLFPAMLMMGIALTHGELRQHLRTAEGRGDNE